MEVELPIADQPRIPGVEAQVPARSNHTRAISDENKMTIADRKSREAIGIRNHGCAPFAIGNAGLRWVSWLDRLG
jgi:hypothetical protein